MPESVALPQVQLERAACPLGCAGDGIPVLTGHDRLHGGPGRFQVVRCRSCGLMRTDPRPTPAAMAAYYPDSYAPYRTSRVEGTTGPAAAVRRLSRRLLETNGTRIPGLPPGRMLEIGCAAGSNLARMAASGWQVQGIETGAGAAAAARAAGLPVHEGDIASAPEPSAPYDLVVGWMVLEHLHDPVGDLRRLAGWVRPGGWLALSVPNAGSWEMRHFGDAWYALQLPTHLHHFTPDTLRAVLDQGGWRTERIWQQRNLRNITSSLAYRARDRGHERLAGFLKRMPLSGGALRAAMHPLAWLVAAAGQSGRMTVWARPAGEEDVAP